MELLILGSESSGKSFLIRKLKENLELSLVTNNSNSSDSDILKTEYVKPTVGVDLITVETLKAHGYKLQLREIGSPMLAKWSSYYLECNAIVIVIDISDTGSFASSYMLLLEILSHQYELLNIANTNINDPPYERKPIILACNKLDIATETNFSSLINIMRLDELKQRNITEIIVMKGSCLDFSFYQSDQGNSLVKSLIDWINSFHKTEAK